MASRVAREYDQPMIRRRVLPIAGGVALLMSMMISLLASAPAAGHQSQRLDVPKVQNPLAAPILRAAEPPLLPTPQDPCGPGSRPETGLQGRVPLSERESGRAREGYTCNVESIGHYGRENAFGTIGGFKVLRYIDESGRECAYYDTTLLYPTNVLDQEGGVNVLDMSDPTKPKLTARLVTPAMLTPHESLVVSQERGLLAAVAGNPAFNLGLVDVYDVSEDCRKPVLKASSPAGVLGHESGLSIDGKTFYSASPATATIVAVGLDNPSSPTPLWLGGYDSHGLSLSKDGDRAYVAGVGSGVIILDTSEVQDRVPNPQVREISRLDWTSRSIPQNAFPVKIRGREYLVEIDEFGTLDEVGAGRIIDIEDEENPKVVSNLRLDVHQPENFDEIRNDPAATIPLQGYAGHYCSVPKYRNPGIVACGMILSGLRIFDIRDPENPREIAYFNSPTSPRVTPFFVESNWAMSYPSYAEERGEIWYSDGYSGFWAVRPTNGVWPFPDCGGKTSTLSGLGRRKVGTSENDRIVGRGRSARAEGLAGKETIIARGGDDRICARSGADRIKAGPGDDRVRGQRGADVVSGGPGDDRIDGGFGNDRLIGGPGADVIDCGKGPRDVAIIGRGDRVLSGCERVRRR